MMVDVVLLVTGSALAAGANAAASSPATMTVAVIRSCLRHQLFFITAATLAGHSG
ncbi:hypothetical protein DFJ69_6033 [Thermomonospora umbrina]|uniref:Secreted protein n=1 Tax=Thermomonospora umbrina TaxID=111806 RepID=A0A3D9SXB8_9ACTN|nr:hypothetical protein DFJ69_6033 [Thermomonospora umbrina]